MFLIPKKINPINVLNSEKNIFFEHINCPLSGLYYNTHKCKSENKIKCKNLFLNDDKIH